MQESDPRHMEPNQESLAARVGRLSAQVVRMHARAGSGHLGGDLSCLPGLAAAGQAMTADDVILLSKGHSAVALYVVLADIGRLPGAALDSYHADGTSLPGHPPANRFDAIPFGTGSLGHGLSLASGLALGRRLTGRPGVVYCLTSDGEWEEGSTWEAFIFACRHQLSNLVVLVDFNGWQALGRVQDVAALGPLADKLAAFPADVVEIDGDDPETVATAIAGRRDRLTVLVLRTTKGRGLGELADTLASHYAVMTADEAEAIAASMEQTR
jgi:transketolase